MDAEAYDGGLFEDDEPRAGLETYADDDGLANGRDVTSDADAEAVKQELQDGAEANAIGLMVAGVRTQQKKCLIACSPEARRRLGCPAMNLVGLTAEGCLKRLPVSMVDTPGNPEGETAEERGASRLLGAWLSWGGVSGGDGH